MRRSASSMTIALASVWLVSCSGQPGQSELRRQVLAGLTAPVPAGVAVIEQVRSVDTRPEGRHHRIAVVSYTLRFLRGLPELRDATEISRTEVIRLLLRYGDFRAGDRIDETRRVTLRRRGHEWVLASG